MLKIVFFLAFVFAPFAASLTAQEAFAPLSASQQKKAEEQIEAQNKQIRDMTCFFTQTKEMAMLSKPARSKGVMYFKPPDAFRWEYTDEPRFAFVQNKGKYYTLAQGKKSEAKDGVQLYKEISQLVVGMIQGDLLKENAKFKTEFIGNDQYYCVILTPVSKNLRFYLSSIRLYFRKTNALLHRLEMYEKNGDVTHILMDDVQLNQNISSHLFQL